MADWSAWQLLEPPVLFNQRSLAETLDGGQAFRWREVEAGLWQGVWGPHVARLRLSASAAKTLRPVESSALQDSGESTGRALAFYLGATEPYDAWTDALPWRSDRALEESMRMFPGLRLLRQPLGETLLLFQCSALKPLAQIRLLADRLAERFGERLSENFRTLPTWEQLARVPESELRELGLGYRAKNIAACARLLADKPGWLEKLPSLPTPEAHAALCTLPRVGPKIADCVLLFALGRREVFPVDTRIAEALRRHYGLEGWSPPQMVQFGRAHFGPQAGLAQQFLYARERAENPGGKPRAP